MLLLALMVGSSLVSVAPSAPAQSPPALLCFDRDVRVANTCDEVTPPDYLMGETVTLDPQFVPQGTYVSVRCVSGCPAQDPSSSEVYWAVYRGDDLHFPADFIDAGPDNDGGNALLDLVPRYNSTWEARLRMATPVDREFNVWLYDARVDGNHTVRPGASHYLRSTGFTPGGEVVYRWERRDPATGRYAPFYSQTATAQSSGSQRGWFESFFNFPKDEARRIQGCGADLFDCYRIVISGAGKQPETVNVQVGPAIIERSLATTPRQDPNGVDLFERSSNVTYDIDLYYPGGRVHQGPKLEPGDIPTSPRHGVQALRVAVERWYAVNETAIPLDETAARFDAERHLWTARWTVPKDMAIDNSARFRLRLLEQHDAYGNLVAEDVLGNFTVEAARLRPRIIDGFRELERTEKGTVRVAILYHNGTPFTPADAPEGNSSPIRGCFVRNPDSDQPTPTPPSVNNCNAFPNIDYVWGRYYEGAWNFTTRYGRGYEDIHVGHRFIMDNGTRDRYDNVIWQVVSVAYTVVPAKQRVDFTTVMRGDETEILERGNRVYVSAAITYPDGTPFNHQVRPNANSSAAQTLTGLLIRRGPGSVDGAYGPIASEEPFNLTETDPSQGRWGGYLQLTDDDTFTPAGFWTFQFNIADNVTVPNKNDTRFDREIVSSLIQVCPTFQPPNRVATGTSIKFRFQLYYSECDIGREVPVGAISTKLTTRLYRYNPQTASPYGAPLSNAIIPTHSQQTNDWGIEYTVPNELFLGSYAFVVTGVDTYGNKLLPTARSRPFSTFTDVLERTVITNPPAEVRRGDSATVVFDKREGDTGVDPGQPAPRIQLERFDTSTTECALALEQGGCWVRERTDVRANDPSFGDHVGIFPVGVDTPVGLYRFSLQGRDAEYHIITGISANFTVNATQVSRSLLTAPPVSIIKGELFSFYVENVPGDKIQDRVVFYNGRPVFVPPPIASFEPGRLNVTWAIPFEAPAGNYTLRLSGRDVNGNIITILTPPIEATAASLEGRLIGQPTKTVERGGDARILFGVGYPDGSFYAAADEPRVFVHDSRNQPIAQAKIRREGLSFAAVWSPTEDTPVGEYTFEVSPQATGATGNLFPTLRSQPFRVVPGTIIRPPVGDLGAELERQGLASYSVPFASDDRFAGFELVYYGPSLSTAFDTTTPLAEVTRTPLTHTIDAPGGKYVASLTTDHQTQTGTYRIVMSGEDAHGNTLVSRSRQFIIRPTTIGVLYDPVPPLSAFGEGKTITLSFTARYRIGTLMDDSFGHPSATVLYNNRPVTQRPEIEYRDGKWYMSWTAPAILPDGEYTFIVGGADIQGNPIATARSTPYIVSTDVGESFAKSVPGPSPAIAILAIAAIALLLARVRRAK